jgi:hypothetical protein
MWTFVRLSAAFFAVCLLILGFALTFGSHAFFKNPGDRQSPVGQIQMEQPQKATR